MRIYVTKMTFSDKDEDATYFSKAYALMDALKEHGHEIVYITDKSFLNFHYVGIFKELASCDCLLAFADKYTLSSSWRLTEITYALLCHGITWEHLNKGFHIPVFVYRGLDDHDSPFIRETIEQPDVYLLPNKIGNAADFINNLQNT